MAERIVDVIPLAYVPRPHRGVFSYRTAMPLRRGALVAIPFGTRTLPAIVLGRSSKRHRSLRTIRSVRSILSATPLLPERTFAFLRWEAEATVTPIGVLLTRALPSSLRRLTRPGIAPFRLPAHADDRRRVRKEQAVYGSAEVRFRIYLARIRETLRRGGQALIAFPTMTAAEDFLAVATDPSIVQAHPLGTKRGEELWFRLREGAALCVVGTRGALRLPFSNLQLVIMDDEANGLWKETREHPYSDGRIAGLTLARFAQAAFVHGGLIPSLDTPWSRTLSFAKFKGVPQGNVRCIDLRSDRPRSGLSASLIGTLRVVMEQSERPRAILYVNRLGSAPSLACRDCGYVFSCATCLTPMPLWRRDEVYRLRCRHCGEEFIPPLVCPVCRGLRLAPRGVGSEEVARALGSLFPNAWIGRLDSSAAPRRATQRALMKAFAEAKGPAFLVGTAMLRLRRFEQVPLVAVVSFEQFLALPSFQSDAEAFETLMALRAMLARNGLLVVQAWHPDHPLLAAFEANDFASFARRELSLRRKLGWPPYRRLAKLTFAHRDRERAEGEAQRLGEMLSRDLRRLPLSLRAELLGPSQGRIVWKGGKYVWQLLLRWKPRNEVDLSVERLLSRRVTATWDIDVHPTSIV